MGGYMGIAFRMPDGEIIRKVKHTNPTSGWLCDSRLLAGDPDVLAAYLALDDEIDHGQASLAPVEYGLVVLDLRENRLLSLQGYTNYGIISMSAVVLATQQPRAIDSKRVEVINLLAETGRLSLQTTLYRPDGSSEEIAKELVETKDSLAELARTYKNHKRLADGSYEAYKFTIYTSPVVIEDFPETEAGAVSMRERLLELGFDLTPADEQGWSKWLDDVRELELEQTEEKSTPAP